MTDQSAMPFTEVKTNCYEIAVKPRFGGNIEIHQRHSGDPSVTETVNARAITVRGDGVIEYHHGPETPAAVDQRIRELLAQHLEDGPCRFDHHGACQDHGWYPDYPGQRCIQVQMRDALAAAGWQFPDEDGAA